MRTAIDDNDFAIAVDPTAAYAAVARNESNALLILDANTGARSPTSP